MATQTIGEVLTYFEGIADGLFITLDRIEKRLNILAGKKYSLSLELSDDISKQMNKAIGSVITSLGGIEEQVTNVSDKIVGSINKVSQQAQDIATTTFGTIGKQAGIAAETSTARTLTLLAGTALAASAITGGIAQSSLNIFRPIETVFTFFKEGINRIGSGLAEIGAATVTPKKSLMQMRGVGVDAIPILGTLTRVSNIFFGSLITSVKDFITLGMPIFKVVIPGTLTSIIGIPLIVRDIVLLTRRLRGAGAENLTVIEKGTRLVSQFHDMFTHSFFRWNSILKTLTLAVTMFSFQWTRLILTFPLINSVVDLITVGIRNRMLQWGVFFGSARSMMALIFDTLLKSAMKIVPYLESMAKSFAKIQKEAQKAGKATKNIKFEQKKDIFAAMSRSAVPVTKQFQGFMLEFRLFMSEIIKRVTEISVVVKNTFLKTKGEFKTTEDIATKSTDKIQEKAKKVGDAFYKGFGSVKKLSFGKTTGEIDKVNERFLKSRDILDAYIKDISANVAPKTIIKTKVAVSSLGETIEKTSVSSKRLSGFLSSIGSTATIAAPMEAAKKAVISYSGGLNTAKTSAMYYGQELQKVIEAVTAYDLVQIRSKTRALQPKSKDESTFTRQMLTSIQNLINKLKEGGEVDFSKSFLGPFIKGMEEYSKKFSGPISTGLISQINKLKSVLSSTGEIKPDTAKVTEALKSVLSTVDTLSEKLQVKAKTSGGAFSSILAKSIKEGDKESYVSAMTSLTDLMMSFLPQSPAKRGPLKGLAKSGAKIPYYIAQGMKTATAATNAATGVIAEGIARYFPRSLPVVGPLVKIVSFGFKIPFYIGQGILKGFSAIKNAVGFLVDIIAKPFEIIKNLGENTGFNAVIKSASDIQYLSKTLGTTVEGTSALDFAMKSVGGSANDLTFTFKALREKISDVGEDAKFLKNIGVDMEAVRKSAEP